MMDIEMAIAISKKRSFYKNPLMISCFGKWLNRVLLSNHIQRVHVVPRHRVMWLLFVMMKPSWGLAWLTEKLSPWFGASQYKNIPIQIQRVYSPMYEDWAWCARVLDPELGWDKLGCVYDDIKYVLEHAQEYIDEIGMGSDRLIV